MYYIEARPLLADEKIQAAATRLSQRLGLAAKEATPSLVALYAILAAEAAKEPNQRDGALARIDKLHADIDEIFATMEEIGAWLEAHLVDESGR